LELSVTLSPDQIGAALSSSLGDGESIAIVSLMARNGEPLVSTPRLLVREDGTPIGGTLGEPGLDEIAAAYAIGVIKDVRKEIVVASAEELGAAVGDRRLLFEIARPVPDLIVCGGGHVGKAVADLARLLDYKVTVVDDRPEFSSRERFPDPKIAVLTQDFVTALRSLKITRETSVVIVTRGHRHDEICLGEVVESPARYVGMIGSRRRVTTIREHLRGQGVKADALRRINAPIGLDIGALTPEEIAIAILAEIVLVRRGGTGIPKSHDGPMARMRERAEGAG
jgi:xanthine dehydrogenase accessory factor